MPLSKEGTTAIIVDVTSHIHNNKKLFQCAIAHEVQMHSSVPMCNICNMTTKFKEKMECKFTNLQEK
jgi:hypothetical protein